MELENSARPMRAVNKNRKKRKYVILGPARGKPAGSGSERPGPAEMDRIARARFSRSRHELIAEAAYYRAIGRGGREGDPDADWREAEAEIEALLRESRPF